MAIQGLQFTILSGQEGHQSYQATGSFVVYNANDGVAYVATDRTATALSWDYKVPSQSGGRFPGPINSYLSIFYLDQSGSGGGGQIVVYAAPDSVTIPHFWSIGRALQGQVTSMDVVTGTQPGNPGAGIARLWVDGAYHLHILDSTGTDRTVLDSTNYQTYIGGATLGGDLYGTLTTGHVGIRNNSAINAYDSGGNLRTFISFGGEILQWAAMGGGFRWVNQANSVQWMALDTSGNLSVGANIYAGIDLHARYIHSSDGSNGAIYSDNGTLFVRANNGNVVMDSGPVNISAGSLTVSGVTYVNGGLVQIGGDPSTVQFYDANRTISAGANGWMYFRTWSSGGWQWVNTQTGQAQLVLGQTGTLTIDPNSNNNGNGQPGTGYWLQLGNASGEGISSTRTSGTNQYGIDFWTSSTRRMYVTNGGSVAHTGQVSCGSSYDNLAHANGFLGPNSNPGGTGLGQNWSTYSSVEHAQQYGLPISPIAAPTDKVKAITGVYYQHMNFDPTDDPSVQPVARTKADGSYDTRPLYGFSARDVYRILPELVGLGPNGQPESIDLDRMVVVLWEAFKELEQKVSAVLPPA